MKKQKRCYNHFLVYRKLMSNIFKALNQQKRKIRTLKKISLLTPFLLTNLVKNNNFLFTKPIKKTQTTKKVFGTIIDKDKGEVRTLLQQMSIPFLKKKIRGTYFRSPITITIKKNFI